MKHCASGISLRYFNIAGARRIDLGDRFTYNLIPIVIEALGRWGNQLFLGTTMKIRMERAFVITFMSKTWLTLTLLL
jgi:hypothetical protein